MIIAIAILLVILINVCVLVRERGGKYSGIKNKFEFNHLNLEILQNNTKLTFSSRKRAFPKSNFIA